MGHGFGELYKGLRIISVVCSPYEIRSWPKPSHTISKIIRRTTEEFLYIVPIAVLSYAVFYMVEETYHNNKLKKPGQYDHES